MARPCQCRLAGGVVLELHPGRMHRQAVPEDGSEQPAADTEPVSVSWEGVSFRPRPLVRTEGQAQHFNLSLREVRRRAPDLNLVPVQREARHVARLACSRQASKRSARTCTKGSRSMESRSPGTLTTSTS